MYRSEEEAGIQAYFDHLLLPARPEDKDKPDRSLGDFLDSIITNPDLKLILLGNLGYFHDDPYRLSLAYYIIALSNYPAIWPALLSKTEAAYF